MRRISEASFWSNRTVFFQKRYLYTECWNAWQEQSQVTRKQLSCCSILFLLSLVFQLLNTSFVCLQILSLDQLQDFYFILRLNSADVISVSKSTYHGIKITINSKYHEKAFTSKHWEITLQRYSAAILQFHHQSPE